MNSTLPSVVSLSFDSVKENWNETLDDLFPDTMDDVPDYIVLAIPYFLIAVFLEFVVGLWKGLNNFRLNDSMASLAAGTTQVMWDTFMKVLSPLTIESLVYAYIYDNYRILELPTDSVAVWWLCFFLVDWGYYWFHRFGHELNIFWASHQVHHSSEDYNLTTALRQSYWQKYTSMWFYFPIALIIPPPMFAIHKQFNTIYQFWIHTEVVDRIGPLEYVLNTPSHHRVHHGRNPYCIDKNYGGTLIIFDRLHGTFTEERKDEPVRYGLVHPLTTFNAFTVQHCHLQWIYQCIRDTPGFMNKCKRVVYGPGWTPEKPHLRLGDHADLPEIDQKEPKYDSYPTDTLMQLYIPLHFAVALAILAVIPGVADIMQPALVEAIILYGFLSLTSFGMLCDCNPVGPYVEASRLVLLLAAEAYYYSLYGASYQFLWVTEPASEWSLNVVLFYRVFATVSLLLMTYHVASTASSPPPGKGEKGTPSKREAHSPTVVSSSVVTPSRRPGKRETNNLGVTEEEREMILNTPTKYNLRRRG
eukprot:Rmarinus@m.25254